MSVWKLEYVTLQRHVDWFVVRLIGKKQPAANYLDSGLEGARRHKQNTEDGHGPW